MRIEPEEDMYPSDSPGPSQCAIPVQDLSVGLVTEPDSPTTVAEIALAFADRYAATLVPLVTQRLARPITPLNFAHPASPKEPVEEGKEEGVSTGRLDPAKPLDDQSQTTDHQDHEHSSFGREFPIRLPSGARDIDPHVTEEALLARSLLQHPLLKHAASLVHPDLTMGGSGPVAPPPPWFKAPEHPSLPKVTALDKHNHLINLPYLRYALIDDEPMIVGTTQDHGPVYGEELKAQEAPPPPFTSSINDSEIDDLYRDYPFNWAINLALTCLGDAGVMADVHHFRTSYSKIKALKNYNDLLNRFLVFIQKEQEAHTREIQKYISDTQAIKDCLVAA